MSRKLILGFLVCLLLSMQGFVLASAATPAPSYVLTATPANPAAGQVVQIALQGTALVDVFAFDVTLRYDPAKLRFKEATSTMTGMSTDPILTDGQVRFAHTKIGKVAGISGNATLATLSFEAIGKGSADVAVSELKIVDSKLKMTTLHPDAKTTVAIGAALAFTDLGTKWAWAAEAIGYLSAQAIVGGTGNGKYEPAKPVNRGELMLMLVRAFGLKAQADKGNFADVPAGKYYASAIATAKSLGIATGDGTSFKPETAVTRQELMVLIDRALQAIGKKLPDPAGTELNAFADQANVSEYAKQSVAKLLKAGFVKGGSGGIEPGKSTNRAETAVILYRILMSQK